MTSTAFHNSIATAALSDVIERQHRALDVFPTGDPEPLKALYSQRDDVTLANPFGPPVRGRSDVDRTLERAAANYHGGRSVGFDRVSLVETPDLACLVEIERYEAKVGGAADFARIALRVTTVFRREDDEWRIVQRHADTTVTPQPAEVVLGRD